MTAEDRPLWERANDAADTLMDLMAGQPWSTTPVITRDVVMAVREAGERLQREAVEAAARDQLHEDVAAFLYRAMVSSVDPAKPVWEQMPADDPERQKYRNIAICLTYAFEVKQMEPPF